MRRDAREAAYKLLFSTMFSGDYDDEFKKSVLEESNLKKEDGEFAEKILSTVAEHSDEIKSIIAEYAKGYKLERIYSTDYVAMEIAVCELTYFDDVPPIVAIDEALWLVRKYSTESSLNFVNGILAAYKSNKEADNG